MDPETKAEMEEMQRKGPITGSEGAANKSKSFRTFTSIYLLTSTNYASVQNFDLAGWMAGKGSGTSTPTSSSGGGGASKRK